MARVTTTTMLDVPFVVTLLCLLPSFISASVISLLPDPRFPLTSEESPCHLSDGIVRLKEGKVFISIGKRSSLLVYIKDVKQPLLSKVETTVVLREPDSYIFIVTEKDEFDFTIEKHNDFIHRVAYETFFGEGINSYIRNEHSNFHVTALRIVESYPEISNSEYSKVDELFDLEEFINEDAITATILDKSETQNNLLNCFNDDITPFINDIETGKAAQQDKLGIDKGGHFDADFPPQSSDDKIKGEQFKIGKFDVPMISHSNNLAERPQFVNSLTGKISQLTKKRKPFTGKNRIPDDTKLLIVKIGQNKKKYYKNITRGSEVWYLRRDEKVFYQCIVQKFSLRNKKPTLTCIDHVPAVVSKVSWDDIFPIESTDLITDLGKFKIKREDFNWCEILKETAKLEERDPNSSKVLPLKREYNGTSNNEDSSKKKA